MKKKSCLKVLSVLVLFLSILVSNTVHAESLSTLKQGVYKVGEHVPAGLTKLSVPSGMADVFVTRAGIDIVWETIDSENIFYPNQITVKLKTGDLIEVYPFSTRTTVQVAKAPAVDLKKMASGLYEVGAEIPAGAYLLDVDQAKNNIYENYIYVYNAQNEIIKELELHPSAAPVEQKLTAGQKVYISELAGTMLFKAKAIIPTSIKLSKTSLAITPTQTYKVTATVAPSDATNKAVTWKSSNTNVATVDASGNIKGIANGSATITATSKATSKVVKSLTVTVSPKTVKLNKTSLTVTRGYASTLTATVSPIDSLDKTVTWKSSNTNVAVVDSKGKVTGKANGTATITATVKNAKAVTAKVTVIPPVAATSVKMSQSTATLSKGKALTLTATVSPSNTTNKTLVWKSSNTNVAKVDAKGKVTAIAAGTAKITATTTNGKTTTATITVPK
ncbi:Ig-like protein group 2 [Planomicrobium soli]|uniref:Ig-like protein group 2 n=1 Tax=Planomicrobium soli TaxID=1176648 RepID=A0A2P8H3E4_9BACL|nr:Ig-like domain-containing protein [Planomicrobium soli]PSL40736.1 Ig-like protein group 2 [Planomicrobium soli]